MCKVRHGVKGTTKKRKGLCEVSPQLNDLPNLKACQVFFMNEIIQEITRPKMKNPCKKTKKYLPKNGRYLLMAKEPFLENESHSHFFQRSILILEWAIKIH
jgi:hypothetical protein